MKMRSVVVRSAIGSLTVMGILAGFQSCKVARSELVKAPDQKQEMPGKQVVPSNQEILSKQEGPVSAALKMDFYLADEGSSVPNFNRPAPSNLMEGLLRDGSGYQLKKRVPLGSEKLFFGISEGVGNQRIVDASYEYHVLSESNQTKGDMHRALLAYDPDHRQYFLSLDQLSKDRNQRLSSMDLQVLTLALRHQDGSISHAEIRFLVKAPLPSAEQIRVSQVFHESKGDHVDAGKTIWTVLTERYTNPTSQPLYLEFSSAGVSYQLATELGVKLNWGDVLPAYRPATEDGFEPDLHRISLAPLNRVTLVFKDLKGETFKTMGVSSAISFPMEILPGQTFDVDWKVKVGSDAEPCPRGERFTRTVWGCDTTVPGESFSRKPWPACRRPQGEFAAFKEPIELDGGWFPQHYRVVGEFKNTVRVTDDIELDAQELLIRTSKPSEPLDPSVEKYSCQGYFMK
ncbi:MAG: hypothetical protein ACJ763_05565 [Bdellovibrionia bacterium]